MTAILHRVDPTQAHDIREALVAFRAKSKSVELAEKVGHPICPGVTRRIMKEPFRNWSLATEK